MKNIIISIFITSSLSNLYASQKDILPKQLHGIWLEQDIKNPSTSSTIRKEFIDNLNNTVSSFPDFSVHLWTTWDNDYHQDLSPKLIIHTKSDLENVVKESQKAISSYLRIKSRECITKGLSKNKKTADLFNEDNIVKLQNILNKKISEGFFASGKDIAQLCILLIFGGLTFDLDVKLKQGILELFEKTPHEAYHSINNPCFMASKKSSNFTKIALSQIVLFYIITPMISKKVENIDFDLFEKSIPNKLNFHSTGSAVFYTSRILLPEGEVNQVNTHNGAIDNQCIKCGNQVFKTKGLYILQNSKSFTEYFRFLKTPSSRSKDTLSEKDDYKFTFLLYTINSEIFKINYLLFNLKYPFIDCDKEKNSKSY